jgi:flap endonuclease-1
MGIKVLSKLIKEYAPNSIEKISYKDLENKIIVFDTSLLIYQFVLAIKNTGKDLMTKEGKITSHIHAIITKTLGILKKKIKPIYVFDGKPPSIKEKIIKSRSIIKSNAKELLANKENISNDEKIKLMKKSYSISKLEIKEIKEILTLIGIPYMESIEEADSQCAYLTKNIAYAVASEDLDILVFGAKNLIRRINNEKNMEIINRDKLLEELELNHEEFIDLCIILGCDYCPKLNKIGMKKAYELIQKYRSIDRIIKEYPPIKTGKLKVNQLFLEKYEIARNYFLKPPVIEINKSDIKWYKPKYDKLKIKLVDKYDYQQKYIDKVLFNNLANGYYKEIYNIINK